LSQFSPVIHSSHSAPGGLVFSVRLAVILWYISFVRKKPLIETNPYLKDPAKRQSLFYTTVASSTAIEGVRVAISETIQPSQKHSKPVMVEAEESALSRR